MSPGGEFCGGVFRSPVAGVVLLEAVSVIAAACDRGTGSSGSERGSVFRQPAVIGRPTVTAEASKRNVVATHLKKIEEAFMVDARMQTATSQMVGESTAGLLRELVAHLRQNRTQLREEWVRRITGAQLLTAMTKEEIFAEATSVYDSYVEALETGTVEALQAYSRNLSERIIPRGVETNEVVGIVLLLRDVLARSLFAKYHGDVRMLDHVLDAYEPAANRIAITVAVGFVQQRERVIREQQEAIRELSTPVLQVRERLLILPIIGLIDPQRARQLTEQLLRGIRFNRAKVVVIDITGVAAMDASVANHLVQTVEAARLLGATVIVTGLSPEIAQTLVNIGVDLGKMNTVGDLQGGIEEAERLLGYKVVPLKEAPQPA
jgi:rsbT co-antagonist protein RsbR